MVQAIKGESHYETQDFLTIGPQTVKVAEQNLAFATWSQVVKVPLSGSDVATVSDVVVVVVSGDVAKFGEIRAGDDVLEIQMDHKSCC